VRFLPPRVYGRRPPGQAHLPGGYFWGRTSWNAAHPKVAEKALQQIASEARPAPAASATRIQTLIARPSPKLDRMGAMIAWWAEGRYEVVWSCRTTAPASYAIHRRAWRDLLRSPHPSSLRAFDPEAPRILDYRPGTESRPLRVAAPHKDASALCQGKDRHCGDDGVRRGWQRPLRWDCIAPGAVSGPFGAAKQCAPVALAAANTPAVRQLPERCACGLRQPLGARHHVHEK
jgi:hypothetical protein